LQKPGKGALLVTTDPPGGIVFVDHAKRGAAPVRIDDLEGRTYAVTIELEGYQQWEGPVAVIGSKEPTSLNVPLRRAKGGVVVQSTPPGARVLIDGADAGKVTPATLADLPSGEHHNVAVR